MPSRMTKPLACSLIAAAVFACGPARADLVTNGGFETGNFSGWTAVLDSLNDGVDTNAPQAGSYGAYFGGANSSISQAISTFASASYKVSFWLKLEADPLGAVMPNAFSFDFGSSAGASLVNAAAFDYTLFETTFVATGASTDLSFHFSQGPWFWDIDSIQVIQVTALPEPASLALLAVAALGGAAATRRRKAGP